VSVNGRASGRRAGGWPVVVVLVGVGFGLFAAAPVAVGATAPAYVTPLMAHTAWTATENCTPVTGVVKLPTILSGHAGRGLTLTGTIVTNWLKDTTRNCIENLALSPFPKPIRLPSWGDLATLRSTYPWFDLASASKDYADMTTLTTSQQQDEACGSEQILVGHGVPAPISLFAYPNNNFTVAMNTMVRSQCNYVLGRRYGSAANTQTSVASGFLIVYSINGGHCTDSTLACAKLATRYPYTPSATLSKLFHPAAGTWIVPQFYRLVTGAKATGRLQWNCQGAESSHYTFDTGGDSTELYCANDYYAAFANEPSYVVKSMNIRQVEAKWGL
jgi:hypothetical protein